METAHTATVAQPVLGDDTVRFVQPRGLVFVTVLWVVALAWALCRGLYVLVLLAFGIRPTAADIVTIAASLLLVPAVAACLVLLVAWNRLGWLHSSLHGITFAATGRRAVSLPWSAVAAVGLRHAGPFTELVVIPTSAAAATVQPGRGRPPRVRHRAGESRYLVDVGVMSPGPNVLLAELHRRIPSRV